MKYVIMFLLIISIGLCSGCVSEPVHFNCLGLKYDSWCDRTSIRCDECGCNIFWWDH